MIISIFCDSLFAEENYFKIKGIKYRMGRDHNGVAIEKTNNSGFFDIYLFDKYYTEECKEGCNQSFGTANQLKMWFGENKNTSWSFPFQLEFEEDVDGWFFSQYYFDFFQSKGLIATEKIDAHESKYRNEYLRNFILTPKEVADLCPSLRENQLKKLECLIYSKNDAESFYLGKAGGIFMPLYNFRFFTSSIGLGLGYTNAKTKLYICKTTDTNYIKNGCDSLTLIGSGEIKDAWALSYFMSFLFLKYINTDGSWEFLKFKIQSSNHPMYFDNGQTLSHNTEIITGELFSYISYF